MSSTQDDVISLHECNFPSIDSEKKNSIPRDNMKIINSIPAYTKYIPRKNKNISLFNPIRNT